MDRSQSSVSHRAFRLVAIYVALGIFCGIAAAAESKEVRPNIVLIMVDDMGWMDLGCQGNPHLHTPAIDRFAAQGMRFTNGYASAPVCSPTRAAILTGRSPARLRITNHLPDQKRFVPDNPILLPPTIADHLPLEAVTIAERLRAEAGYQTAFLGKWHLYVKDEHQFGPTRQGFDLNLGGCAFGGPPSFFDPYRNPFLKDRKEGEYLPDRLVDETIRYIDSTERDRPFFISLFNYAVHWPMEAPEDLISKYAELPVEGYRDHRYAAMIEALDGALGKLFEYLDERQLADNTLIILTSDNGPFGGVGDPSPLRAEKGHLYEGGIRVPFIARFPKKIPSCSVVAEPIILTDLFPTFLSVAGLQINESDTLDGRDLWPLLKSEVSKIDGSLYWHAPNYAFHRSNRLGSAVRTGRYKLIEFFDDDSVELYDLEEDVSESNNLADALPKVASAMLSDLRRWRNECDAQMPTRVGQSP